MNDALTEPPMASSLPSAEPPHRSVSHKPHEVVMSLYADARWRGLYGCGLEPVLVPVHDTMSAAFEESVRSWPELAAIRLAKRPGQLEVDVVVTTGAGDFQTRNNASVLDPDPATGAP